MLAVVAFLIALFAGRSNAANDRPIIGILTQRYGLLNINYIASSYVKFVESGGAQVVPIHINRNETYYEELLAQLNGVLFPGGGAPLDASPYGKAGKFIVDYAIKANQNNDYFPLWGTCNGFELLAYLASNGWPLIQCDSMNQASTLKFTPAAASSRLLGNRSQTLRFYLQEMNVTANFHRNCLTMENFTRFGINEQYKALATSVDNHGLEYISAIEGKEYPFYGTQFHPEKNAYEWSTWRQHSAIPHTKEAIEVTQFFARFFVNEARKSMHRMDEEYFAKEAIYNFKPEFTGRNSTFTQVYFFTD